MKVIRTPDIRIWTSNDRICLGPALHFATVLVVFVSDDSDVENEARSENHETTNMYVNEHGYVNGSATANQRAAPLSMRNTEAEVNLQRNARPRDYVNVPIF